MLFARYILRGIGTVLAWIIGIFTALLWVNAVFLGVGNWVVVVTPPALLSGWFLWGYRHDGFKLVANATLQGYLAVAASSCWLISTGNTNPTTWTLVAVAATVNLSVRTTAQEFYLFREGDIVVKYGVQRVRSVTIKETARIEAPFLFRWFHRVGALWWVWGFVAQIRVSATDHNSQFASYWLVLIGFGCILAGPFSLVVLFLGNIFTLLFLANENGGVAAILWMMSNFAWLMWVVLRTPSDRRFNSTHAFAKASNGSPWRSWG